MFLMDASTDLNLNNSAYEKAAELYVWGSYMQDLGSKGDLTSHAFVQDPSQVVSAKLIAKQDGILAGVAEAEWFLKKLNIKDQNSKRDGEILKKGDLIMEVSGRADELLSAERTLLNLLQRMSGIATKTAHLRSKLHDDIQLLATRKTVWGDLDKKAVAIGGGATHRLNLGDAILIKENHLKLSSGLEVSLNMAFRKLNEVRFVEIELENLDQVQEFVEVYKKLPANKKMIVMLDNFSPEDVQKAVGLLSQVDVTIEVSGGIDENNISQYALSGVDAISSGSITNKAPALDISMLIS